MKKFCVLVLMIGSAVGLISWGVVGHKTAATIASKHLTPKATLMVKSLLGDTAMADISSWADQILREPAFKNTAPRHYINAPLGLSYPNFVQEIKSQPQENVYKAIKQCEQDLKDPNLSLQKKREALKFIIHFVGDLHQPMHVSRAEDKGGNTIQLQFEGQGTNMHSLWDSKLIAKEGKSFDQMALDYDTATPKQIAEWQKDELMKWLYESYQISSQLYPEIELNNKLGDEYYVKYMPVVQQRILKAGIRLAGLLNSIATTYDFKKVAAVK